MSYYFKKALGTRASKIMAVAVMSSMLQACSRPTYHVTPDWMASNIAKYAVLKPNKAMYLLHSDDVHVQILLFWEHDQPNLTNAVENAKSRCESNAKSMGRPATECIPVALNDKQVLDYTAFYEDPVAKAQGDRAAQDLSNALGDLGAAMIARRKSK